MRFFAKNTKKNCVIQKKSVLLWAFCVGMRLCIGAREYKVR